MQIENVFSQLPQVTTDRLVLRRMRASDVDDIYAYACDTDVARYTSWAPHTSLDETRQFVRRVLDAYLEKRVASWGLELKAERKLIGTGGDGCCGVPTHQRPRRRRAADAGHPASVAHA